MKSKLFLRLIVIVFISILSSNVFAEYSNVSEKRAKDWANRVGHELIDVLSMKDGKEKFDKLDVVLKSNVDMPYLAKFVIGRYWRTMTDDQKEQYIPLFERYLLAIYKTFPVQFKQGNIEYKISKVVIEKNYTNIYTEIVLKTNAEPLVFNVEFRIHDTNDRILVTDIKIIDTSFLIVFRNRFTEILQSDDGEIEWFLEDLKDIVVSAERANKENVEGY